MRRLSSTFQTLILQPTPLCNLNCAYCYICPSSRKARRDMSVPVAAALASSIRAQKTNSVIDVVWHGGEPLATRRDHFEDLVEAFEPLRAEGRIRHFIQTNATLINDEWCDFFTRYEFRVGVSLDGPAFANTNRMDWAGKPVFPRIMRGVQALKDHGIGFSVICVVSPETVSTPDALFDFFEDLGAGSVGFNIEEYEGANDSRQTIDASSVRRFWRAMFARLANGSDLRIREAGKLLGYLAEVKAGRKSRWADIPHDPIPTVSWNGDTVLLSPELLGTEDERYSDFIVGNVLDESLPSMIARAHDVGYVKEFLHGVDDCQQHCAFFDFCQGGQAGNRYFESGKFTQTETNYCRSSKQELVIALQEQMGA